MPEVGGRVQSIEKAVRILELLAEAGEPMPLREIARRTGLPKSTLHGIISTLRETGLVEQSAVDGCYGHGGQGHAGFGHGGHCGHGHGGHGGCCGHGHG